VYLLYLLCICFLCVFVVLCICCTFCVFVVLCICCTFCVIVSYVYLFLMCICCTVYLLYFRVFVSYVYLLYCVFVVPFVYLFLMCICCTVYLLYCVLSICFTVCIDVFTLDAGLLSRSQYSEGPATGHLDIGFSWFPCVFKQMLRWFPTFQVATTCCSCSPPDANLVGNQFHVLYTC
jgi:hypothetical protein